ncbi:Iduronate 2-sulfatase [Hondaea fermentalgiana]|uniref:Iduronate 2-sulfatase n=1 Tax=Hondaea fermentalgiana TaxID=2315210 RepID=A0A2R5GFQ4_9STRA|nr:Iduronate 2-sulfatase [Hondaea fermentalgiana]|eukprot:GBG29149.1 Iduronate 2-sulfatase [Hondaea fermentalgiana]
MQGVLTLLVLVLVSTCLMDLVHGASSTESKKLNVLLVMVDDFRPEASAYGSSDVSTPNMDALAKESVQFERAYTQEALCGPSRGSMLSARLPTSLGYYIHTDAAQERTKLKSALVLPKWFESQGYDTFGTSKIFHWVGNNARYFGEYDKQGVHGSNSCGDDVVCADSDTLDDFTDYRALEWATTQLDKFATKSRYTNGATPWFLVVGFRRPHTKFRAPKSFFERFSADEISLPSAIERERPTGAPWQAYKGMCADLLNSNEVRASGFLDPYEDTLADDVARKFRMGYFACVEWIDYAMGQLLDRLDTNGLKNETLVVVTSDHGWSLGEKTSWCKGSVYERALRVPMWIRDPVDRSRAGTQESAGVSLLDLYPTIAELAGVPLAQQDFEDYEMDGRSFAHLVRDDDDMSETVAESLLRLPQLGGHEWSFPSNASFSVWPICVADGEPNKQVDCRTCKDRNGNVVDCQDCASLSSCSREESPIAYMGLSVRTERFRYTEWRAWDDATNSADWDAGDAGAENRELYDHDTKLGSVEMENVVDKRAYETNAEQHANMLRARFATCSGITDETKCSARGDHCVFHNGNCMNRGFCAFSGPNSFQDCAARAEACVWSPLYNQCVNRIKEGRSAPISAPPTTPEPTLAPTRPPAFRDVIEYPTETTPAPSLSPTPSSAFCKKFRRRQKRCVQNGCAFFKGIGCREPTFCDFKRQNSTRRKAGCSENSDYCSWDASDKTCVAIHD